MTLYGALVHAESADPVKCALAVDDLNLDLVVIGFVLGAYPLEMYDKWCIGAIPQHKILAMISLPTGEAWPMTTPADLAKQAAEIAARYPGIEYFEVINEPDVKEYYPPVGISPAKYHEYYAAVAAALPGKTVLGPNTSQWLPGFMFATEQAFHGYGAAPPLTPFGRFWMTEKQDLVGGPVAVWREFYGFHAAIFYQLQDSPDSPGSGLLDAAGNRRQPWYDDAKAFLRTPAPTPEPWWMRLLKFIGL